MLMTQRKICEGGRLPFGYAVAYFQYDKGMAVCYPVGFHLLMRWAKYTWWAFVKHYRLSPWESEILAARNEGERRGEETGERLGHARARREIEKIVETYKEER